MSCSWDGTSWTLGWENGHAFQLKAKGVWASGYRPSKIRMSYAGAATTRVYIESLNHSIFYNDTYVSDSEETLDFSDNEDILYIGIQSSGGGVPWIDFDVTNIEFLN